MPLFPLSVCLLPGEQIQLHIFEPRYRQMFAELRDSETVFGIPYTEGRVFKTVGSRCRLVKVIKEYTGGESDVLIECDGLFRLQEFQSMKEDKLYPFGTVSLLRDIMHEKVSPELQDAYTRFCSVSDGGSIDYEVVDSDLMLVILASLNLSSEEKLKVIVKRTAAERDEALLQQIKLLTILITQEQAVEQGIYLS